MPRTSYALKIPAILDSPGWSASPHPLDGEGEVVLVDRRRGEAGAVLARLQALGQSLAGDPVAVRGERRRQLRGGAVAYADAVGVVEVGLLAGRLQPVHRLARPPLGDQLGGEGDVERHQQLAVGGGGEARLLDEAHLE